MAVDTFKGWSPTAVDIITKLSRQLARNVGKLDEEPGSRIVPSCHPGWGAVSDLGGSFAERGFKIGHRHCGTTTRAIKTAPFN